MLLCALFGAKKTTYTSQLGNIMEELITRIAQAADITPDTATTALGMILNFFEKNAPEQASALMDYLPGAQELINSAATESTGLLGGLMGGLLGSFGGGGGVMALGSQLMAQGLSFAQIQTIGNELIEFGRQNIGPEQMTNLINAIPGLADFL